MQDLRYFYDAVGNITDTRDDAQQTVFFNNAVIGPHQAYEYDALYRLVYASGREHVSLGQPANTERPVGPLPNPNDPQALRTYVERYDYDNVGNILQVRHEAVGGSWTRRYDYAADGNRLLATSAPGDGPGVHSAVYDYNSHGSISAMPHLAAVDWDHAEQMRHANLGGGGDVWLVYDSAGQRVRKVQVNAAGSTRTERIYLGGYEVYREHVGGALETERQTLHVADGSGRVCMLETLTVDDGVEVVGAANTSRYQYGNHLGTVGLELDGSGLLISYEEFHPYGSTAYRAANSAIEVSASRYRYTGQERDEETGLGHHGARYYAGWLGRWTSADPIGLGDGVNRYRYASNRPMGLNDPSGTFSIGGVFDSAKKAVSSVAKGAVAVASAASKVVNGDAESRKREGLKQKEEWARAAQRNRAIARRDATGAGDEVYIPEVVAEEEAVDLGVSWPLMMANPAIAMSLMTLEGVANADREAELAGQYAGRASVTGDGEDAAYAVGHAALAVFGAMGFLPIGALGSSGGKGVGVAGKGLGLVDDAGRLVDDSGGVIDDVVPAASDDVGRAAAGAGGGGGVTFLHGSDVATVESIAARGIDRSAAARVGGGRCLLDDRGYRYRARVCTGEPGGRQGCGCRHPARGLGCKLAG